MEIPGQCEINLWQSRVQHPTSRGKDLQRPTPQPEKCLFLPGMQFYSKGLF